MKTFAGLGARKFRDGVHGFLKEPESDLLYSIKLPLHDGSTSLTSNPVWTSSQATITDTSFTITGGELILKLRVLGNGDATVRYEDNSNNKEVYTIRFAEFKRSN